MKNSTSFLRENRKGIFLFFLFTGIFALVFALYRLPVESVGYAALICAAAGLMVLVPDFVRKRKKHDRLIQLRNEILVTLDTLPEPENWLEKEYQEALRLLFEEKQRLTVEMEQRYGELVDYYSVWAHQIKTPIAAMRLILQSGDSEENQELREELRRIEQYVEMVMCYLRLDAGSTDYVIREYDLDELLRQAIRRNASLFIRQKIRLVYEPLEVRVVTDEKWLLFVVEQVLSNALKYTENGGTITITLEQPKTLCIQDTGTGIAPEDLPRIFEKGYTGYNGRADKKASGIGLYLCRRICSNLGHSIWAESYPEYGTKIRIDLNERELEVE